MLSGDVNDFALRDVLQLLATTKKSGLLTLRVAGGSGAVLVRDGGVCLALVDVTRVALGHWIVSAGLADATTVRNTLRTADASAFDLACALMRAVSDSDKARALATEHTRDAIGWLSQYADARFEFDSTVKVEAWPFEPLATGEVLAEVEGNAQHWARLHGVVGDLSLVPHCVPNPKGEGERQRAGGRGSSEGEGERQRAGGRGSSEGAAEISLTALQWRVVALVDGHRNIRALIESVGLGQLDLCRELGGLVGKGLIELVGPDGRRTGNTQHDDALPDIPRESSDPNEGEGDVEPDGEVEPGGDVEPDGDVSTPDVEATITGDAAADDPVVDEPGLAQAITTSQPTAVGDANVGLLNRLIGKSKSA